MSSTITGMRPVEGTSLNAGSRDFSITLEREGYEDISVAELFTDLQQTFDLTEAVEFTTTEKPSAMARLRVGDVLTMRVVINT